ncbi:MAG: hypothetical protein VYC34_09750, partial [Planctomycetota bacterium]|nr:hypothetical protein [Planctomycetota bacterium]
NYKARKGIDVGSITLHPQGIPHGPHPGTVEKSLGATFTNELAVMCDTFRPMYPTKAALKLDDEAYPKSWIGVGAPGSVNGSVNGHPAKSKGGAEEIRGGEKTSDVWAS